MAAVLPTCARCGLKATHQHAAECITALRAELARLKAGIEPRPLAPPVLRPDLPRYIAG